MKFRVRLQRDLEASRKPGGIPDDWPAEIEEVEDNAADPGDGRLVLSPAEYEDYVRARRPVYEAWAATGRLSERKERLAGLVDRRVQKRLADGFTHRGSRFSLEPEAMVRWQAYFSRRQDPGFSYPVSVSSLRGRDVLSLANAPEVAAFMQAAWAAIRDIYDAAEAVKNQIRSARDEDSLPSDDV